MGALGGLAAPTPVTPEAGKHVEWLPQFGWTPVRGAAQYEFALAADKAFTSPVLGGAGDFTTQNIRTTLAETVPNGTYWWHVRAISSSGSVGPWSSPQWLVKSWTYSPKLAAPKNTSRVAYPTPLVLTWRPVIGAATYDVAIATDSQLASLVNGSLISTSASSLTPTFALQSGITYYWAVTPVDAAGDLGVRSPIYSFTWVWPSAATQLSVTDLIGPNEVKDPVFGSPFATAAFAPQFHWKAVPGATSYEIEINSDKDWAASSKVCCGDKILGPPFTPLVTLPNNRYYWRVRAFDAAGNPGRWVEATDSFVKTFDNVCFSELTENCVAAPGPSVRGLHVQDWSGANVTHGDTSTPVVVWDPVPGASSYQWSLYPCNSGASAEETVSGSTPVSAWTPIGEKMQPGTTYCFSLRALSDKDVNGNSVYGDLTELERAFTYVSPSGGARVASLPSDDYLTPAQGAVSREMPFFTWRPVAGAQAYQIVIARDQSFTDIVDSCFVPIAAYAPRKTYTDETTTYYWVVLPVRDAANVQIGSCTNQPPNFNPTSTPAGRFQKEIPPANLQVTQESTQPTFSWDPVVGALKYNLQVSADPDFGTTIENATTDSTSYTAEVAYPPGKTLYWRVQAEDADGLGLSWSAQSFPYRLPTPNLSGNQGAGDAIPTWRWSPVPGAVSYDVQVELPGGGESEFSSLSTAALTQTSMSGTGIFRWSVRAEFPGPSGTVPGPYSRPLSFDRTISSPTGAHSLGAGSSLVLAWQPKLGAKQYTVQIATNTDFSSIVEQSTTDNPVYAPNTASSRYAAGGTFYWRISAVDADGNTSDYTSTREFWLPKNPH